MSGGCEYGMRSRIHVKKSWWSAGKTSGVLWNNLWQNTDYD